MPVVTRSQFRKFQEEKQQLHQFQQEQMQLQQEHQQLEKEKQQLQEKLAYDEKKIKFLSKTKLLLRANEIATSQRNRIIAAIDVMKSINAHLPELLGYNEFNRFCLTVYNKVLEFQTEYTTNGWPDVEPDIASSLIDECNIAKQIVANHANTFNTKNEWIDALRLKLKTDKPFVYVRRSSRIARA